MLEGGERETEREREREREREAHRERHTQADTQPQTHGGMRGSLTTRPSLQLPEEFDDPGHGYVDAEIRAIIGESAPHPPISSHPLARSHVPPPPLPG